MSAKLDWDPALELPHTPDPSVHLWSENFCYQGYDAAKDIGFWLHIGSVPNRPEIWRQIFVVYLPGGEILAEKSFGRGSTESGPGASTMSLTCVKPFERFEITFDGCARALRSADLDEAGLSDGLHQQIRAELAWSARSPMWAAGEQMTKQAWGHIHHEQLCSVSGFLDTPAGRVQIEGTGIRDHTVGPRDFTTIQRHVWISGLGESGRGFVLLAMESTDGVAALSRGFVLEGGVLHEAQPIQVPYLDSVDRRAEPARLVLRYHGRTAEIDAQILHNVSLGLIPPNEVTVGFDRAAATNLVVEGQSRFTWDGELLHGLTERSLRV